MRSGDGDGGQQVGVSRLTTFRWCDSHCCGRRRSTRCAAQRSICEHVCASLNLNAPLWLQARQELYDAEVDLLKLANSLQGQDDDPSKEVLKAQARCVAL